MNIFTTSAPNISQISHKFDNVDRNKSKHYNIYNSLACLYYAIYICTQNYFASAQLGTLNAQIDI